MKERHVMGDIRQAYYIAQGNPVLIIRNCMHKATKDVRIRNSQINLDVDRPVAMTIK